LRMSQNAMPKSAERARQQHMQEVASPHGSPPVSGT
jgi:hypothetical protein